MITGIGETILDIIFKNDQPVAAVPGGSTFNALISLGRVLGGNPPVLFVTEVGNDHVGDIIVNFLADNGVSAEYVCRHEQNNLRPVVGALLRSAHEAGAWLYYDVNFRKNHIAELPELMPNIVENMRLADVVRGSMEDFGYLFGLNDDDAIYDRVSRLCSTLILTDGAKSIRVYTPKGCESYPVQPIETVSTVGAGDNFNAGYIYAMLQGKDEQAQRIEMAQRWSQDVCQQIGNNISDELVAELKAKS